MHRIPKFATASLIVLLACTSAGCTTPSFTTEDEPVALASTGLQENSSRESLAQLQQLAGCMFRKAGELRSKPSVCGLPVFEDQLQRDGAVVMVR